jgi:hypothetical protein
MIAYKELSREEKEKWPSKIFKSFAKLKQFNKE